jgi:threonine/homoserine efflux transporter RhtA
MVGLAIDAPFMRWFPSVWVPALCWVILVVLGLWFLLKGAIGSQGPRDPRAAVWAVNEVAIVGVLLWWGVYVPETWKQGFLINFGLEGIYLGLLAGGVMRFLLAVRGSFARGTVRSDESDLQHKAKHWLGRFRRY